MQYFKNIDHHDMSYVFNILQNQIIWTSKYLIQTYWNKYG